MHPLHPLNPTAPTPPIAMAKRPLRDIPRPDDPVPMLALLDELSHGAVLVAQDARVLYASRAARHVLAQRQALAVIEGRLQAPLAPDQLALSDALMRAGAGRRSMVSVGRPDDGAVTLAVFPLPGRADAPGPIAVVLSRASLCDPLMLCFFARAHGLTATEEQVLSLLCEGLGTPGVAARMGVAVSTVRSHVRSLCNRTGASGARSLVHRVASLPAVAGSLQPGLVH